MHGVNVNSFSRKLSNGPDPGRALEEYLWQAEHYRLLGCLQMYNKTSMLICLAMLALNPLMNEGKRALGLSLSLLP